MRAQLQSLQGSVTGKVLFIGLLILLLLVPLSMIESLIYERTQHYETARASVANAHGEAQTLGGPILLSEQTRAALVHRPPNLRPVGKVEVRGRQSAVVIWTVDGAR